MPKQAFTVANELLRDLRTELKTRGLLNKPTRDFLHNMRIDIAEALVEREKRGEMFGAAVMAGAIVNGYDECVVAKHGLVQFGQSADDWKGLDLTPYDMRAVRKAFKQG